MNPDPALLLPAFDWSITDHSVTSTPVEVCQSKADRVSLILSNYDEAGDSILVWPGRNSSGRGLRLAAGERVEFTFKDFGVLVGLPWFATDVNATGSTMSVIEVSFRPQRL